MPTVGSKLKAFRLKRGMTQKAVSAKGGLSVAAIVKLERGDRLPSWTTISKLAAGLGVSMSRLMKELE